MIQPRRHLRSDVTAEVQERLLAGDMPVGRINESELAAELGISRTPLREALLVMEQRGLVDSAMGRGFLVRDLDLDEAEELYSLLAVLEPMAVRLGASALAARTPVLRDLLGKMGRTHDLAELQGLAQDWSAHITDACPNRKLAAVLGDLYRLSARYERLNLQNFSAAPGGLDLGPALAQHTQIVDALAAGDVDAACTRLAENTQGCLAALRQYFQRR